MDTVLSVQLRGQIVVIPEQFVQRTNRALPLNLNPFEEVRSQPAAPPDRAGLRRCAIDDRLPLELQQGKESVGKPIHVIQQYETRNLAWVPLHDTGRLPVTEPHDLVLVEARRRLSRHRLGGGAWPASATAAPAPCFTWRGVGQHLWRTPKPWGEDA